MAFGGVEGDTVQDDGCAAKGDTDAQLRERLRVQELLRYFQPYEGNGAGEGKARVSADPALTAFTQLCAHKLNCQRSFMSIITDSKQFTVAEATRTVSLKDEDVHDNDDGIYLGQCIIDFEWGVCPDTIACFTSPDDSLDINTPFVKATRSYYVMNDMSILEGYKDRPYVAGWPYMKYYAEVPIHSPSGLTIGTLCVVDGKPRDGLDLKGLAILREISEVIMHHLELCVNRIQRNNAEKMIQALGKFVEGKDSVREWWIEAQASRFAEPGMQHLSIEKRADIELGINRGVLPSIDSVVGSSDDPDLISPSTKSVQVLEILKSLPEATSYFDTAPASLNGSSSPGNIALPSSNGDFDKPVKDGGTPSTSPEADSALCTETENPPSANHLPTNEPSSREKTLYRATNLIREGIGLDGMILFDPRSSDGQLLMDFNSSGEKVVWSDRRSSNPASPVDGGLIKKSSSYFPPSGEQKLPMTKYCKVLASSARKKTNANGPTDNVPMFPETVLQDLLQRYPRGGILNYDKRGFIGGNDACCISSTLRHEPNSNGDGSREANQLRTVLPDVMSVLLLPLWDPTHDKWFAYGLAWTTNPNRIFEGQDFAYLASFGNSVMTEISRLETVAADNAKSTFISSISHELRSPLHGIMASVELLRDVNSDPTSNAIISTVESCGSTLLDTIDNLLTFAKVNRKTARTNSVGVRQSLTVNMSALVEEVTHILIAGYYFRRKVEASGVAHHREDNNGSIAAEIAPGLMIICDISPACDGIFETDAGVWKRILMNLLGNSLKYTPQGFILVKLRLEEAEPTENQELLPEIQESCPRRLTISSRTVSAPATSLRISTQLKASKPTTKTFDVILTVEDSGKGMSQDYLTHHLFKPFYQEDILSPGTGLGLSIVHQMVTSLGGTIHVSSERGVGTEVRIKASLELQEARTTPPTSPTKFPQLQDLRLGIRGLEVVPDLMETPNGILGPVARRVLALRSILIKYAMSLGLTMVGVDSLESTAADIILISEVEYRRLPSSQSSSFTRKLVVLAAEPMLRYGENSADFGPVVVLPQPFGPRRFRQALETCMLNMQTPPAPTQHSTLLPVREQAPKAITNKHTTPSSPIPGTTIAQPQTSLLPSGQKRLSLLLVEDNPINLKLLVTSFKKMGHLFSTATDGVEAVAAYRKSERKFDIVFMDIQMPVMDGMEASFEIRKYEKEKGLAAAIIIALTALTSSQAEQEALDAGADRFMSKPVSMKKLREVVGEYFVEGGKDGN